MRMRNRDSGLLIGKFIAKETKGHDKFKNSQFIENVLKSSQRLEMVLVPLYLAEQLICNRTL